MICWRLHGFPGKQIFDFPSQLKILFFVGYFFIFFDPNQEDPVSSIESWQKRVNEIKGNGSDIKKMIFISINKDNSKEIASNKDVDAKYNNVIYINGLQNGRDMDKLNVSGKI